MYRLRAVLVLKVSRRAGKGLVFWALVLKIRGVLRESCLWLVFCLKLHCNAPPEHPSGLEMDKCAQRKQLISFGGNFDQKPHPWLKPAKVCLLVLGGLATTA